MSITAVDAMNDALEICSDLGYEMVPGFATHWAMGSETIIQLGFPEVVHDWATAYRVIHKHFPRPPSTSQIDGGDPASWKAARGDWSRVGDWQIYFDRELDGRPWRDILVEWWPRLIPGVSAGLTHGLIRTAHAVRSLATSDPQTNPLQLRELATGLAYWAAKYIEQPGPAGLSGKERLPELLAAIPRLELDGPAGLRERGSYQYMPQLAGWPEAVGRLQNPEDLQAAFSDLTLAFVQVNLAHPDQFPVPLIHCVTMPTAIRQMLAHLPKALHIPSYVAAWQANAAILAMFAPGRPSEIGAASEEDAATAIKPEELASRAVEHGDEHAIKLTEACLREYRIRPDPRYLKLVEQMLTRIPRPPRTAGR